MTKSDTKKIRVVLDTNIYIAGISFPGKPREILELMRRREIEVYVSEFILGEIERILKNKFDWAKERINRFVAFIREQAIVVHPQVTVSVVTEKKDDNRILECAIQARVHFLITGDKKHLLPLKEYEGVKILSPAEFLELYGEKGVVII